MNGTGKSNDSAKCGETDPKCFDREKMGTLLLPFIPCEGEWHPAVRGVLYFLLLVYFFMGVAIASDIFMTAIEYIVSKSKEIPFEVNGKRRSMKEPKASDAFTTTLKVQVRVWNPTVANLTLMALGSSAPEILLSCIEVVSHRFVSEPGDLGPGTIVGSAAFNLLFITAVCILFVPRGEKRRIEIYNVFMITTLFSLFAYFWMWIVLTKISPNMVEIWEAVVTLLCFPLLVLIAWWADNKFCLNPRRYQMRRSSFGEKAEELEADIQASGMMEDFTPQFLKKDETPFTTPTGALNSPAILAFYRELMERGDLSEEEAASLVAYKLVEDRAHSRMWYRAQGGMRALLGGTTKVQPTLTEKLKQVYNLINQTGGTQKRLNLNADVGEDVLQKKAMFDFKTAAYSIPENIGTLTVTIIRSGKADNEVDVKVVSFDGTAKAGKAYHAISTDVLFEPFVFERTVDITIIDDKQWNPDTTFFLKLSLDPREDAVLGPVRTMEITIVDDDKPGVIAFAKRGQLVSETVRQVDVDVTRTGGSDGIVSVQYKTIPDPNGGVKHPTGMVGKLTFNHGETKKHIRIPLFQENNEGTEAETFDVELFNPDGGASIGKMDKCSVTISDDAEYQETVNKMVALAAHNMDIVGNGHTTIGSQMKEAFNVGDDEEEVTRVSYCLHFFMLPWKVLLALIPPPNYCGGWLCFIISLVAIGILTALIGDIATIFGCICKIRPTVTAITFVALGTSLPDTFASMTAAKHDPSADNAIGNVTGSNSVNVFLGLGLPWTIAAIYNKVNKKEGFAVPAGSLGFSVLVYSVTAGVGIFILVLRRYMGLFGKAELGGPVGPKIFCFVIFIGLWSVYIVVSALEAYGIIVWEKPSCSK